MGHDETQETDARTSGEDASSADNIVKVGAFVSRPRSANDRLSMAEDDEDDPLLQLCSPEPDKPTSPVAPAATDQAATAEAAGSNLAAKLEGLAVTASACGSIQKKSSREDKNFVMLDLKTPFSAKSGSVGVGVGGTNPTPGTPHSAGLGIFFKDQDQSSSSGGPPQDGPESLNLASQLDNLNQQLEDFEKDLEEFDEMWKTMEVAPTSESESEKCVILR